MDAAAALKGARHRAGLSQRQLAGRSGVAQPMIARIESGAGVPRLDTFVRLLAACDARLDVQVQPASPDVDRSMIRELLALTPAERAARAVADAAGLAGTPPAGVLARRAAPKR
jgi:transcriptional regulator with XRE-family HTH domain